jgi:hypothetical protein
MFNNDSNRHMRFDDRTEKMLNKARNCFNGLSLLAICLLVVLFAGCSSDEVKAPNLKFNLSVPEITEKIVSLNGGASVPLKRIQWEWGDGQTDKHHFFPASHNYNNPGRYQITVTVFDNDNNTASKSVSIEIK